MGTRRLHIGFFWLGLLLAGALAWLGLPWAGVALIGLVLTARSTTRQRRRFVVLAALAAVLTVSACGEDKALKAEAAAKWLSDYSREHPLPHGWRVREIRTSKDSDVVAEVVVPRREMEADIRSRSRMQQIEILQLACPPRDAEIWKILEKRQTLWVSLSGTHKVITRGACRKPNIRS